MASSSSLVCAQKHDLYLSVRNEDAIKFIADMMATSLACRGVPTFKDEKKMRSKQRGTNLGRELKEAIGMSTISIVLFSKDYLCSSWCLEELVAILECRKRWGLIVLPIFYDVDPSDIRNLRGDAAKLVNNQRKGGVWYGRWKSAMKVAADFCGWDHTGKNGPRIESTLVGDVVEAILHKRIPTNLNISIYPMRYDTCDQYLNLLLQFGADYVLIVGICGPAGMGKTEIAKAAYEQLSFTAQGSSFLKSVGQKSRKPDGLIRLQEKLLSDCLQGRHVKVMNATRGMDAIKENLNDKRVVIVLDDVDHLDQLHALVGDRSWFGFGSKIIITTRKLYLLNLFEVDQVFLAHGLPLPPNIKVIWQQFQRSRHIVAGLREYIHLLHQLTPQKERDLEKRLLEEREQTAAQAQLIAELMQAQGRVSSLVEPH